MRFPKKLAKILKKEEPRVSDIEEDSAKEEDDPEADNLKDKEEAKAKMDEFLKDSKETWRWYGHTSRRLEEYDSEDEQEQEEVEDDKEAGWLYAAANVEEGKEPRRRMMAKRTGVSVGEEKKKAGMKDTPQVPKKSEGKEPGAPMKHRTERKRKDSEGEN